MAKNTLNNSLKPNQIEHAEYYLGCDVAKYKLDVSLVNLRGTELMHQTIDNTNEDIVSLLLKLADGYGNDTVTCAIEATSIYHLP